MRSTQELIDSITKPIARSQFDEALRAYSAGAYRAATILLWTAVMHDFTEKLRLLAESDDAQAAAVIADLDKARDSKDIRGMQRHESSLLQLASEEFELITPREAEELARLGHDRNLCAHPSFQPDSEDPIDMTPEQVRAYARLVADAVLSQPTIVGKHLVDQFTRDTKGESWPNEDVVEFVRNRYFKRARRASLSNIISLAIKSSIRPPDSDNGVAGRCVATVHAAEDIDEALTREAISKTLEKWRDSLSDTDLLRMLGAIGSIPQTWSTVGDDNIARTKALLSSAPTDLLIEHRAFASGPPFSKELQEPYRQSIDRLSLDQFELLTTRPYPKVQWSTRTLSEVRKVRNWRGGERAMRLVLQVAKHLTLGDIEVLCEQFLSNDQINRAADMPQIIQRLIADTESIPGSTGLWQKTLQAYTAAYDPEKDPSGHYDYSEARQLVGI